MCFINTHRHYELQLKHTFVKKKRLNCTYLITSYDCLCPLFYGPHCSLSYKLHFNPNPIFFLSGNDIRTVSGAADLAPPPAVSAVSRPLIQICIRVSPLGSPPMFGFHLRKVITLTTARLDRNLIKEKSK